MTRTGKYVGRVALALGLISASSVLVGGLVQASVAHADIGVPLPVTSPTPTTSSVPLPVPSPTDVTSAISPITSTVPLPVSDPTPTPTPTSTSTAPSTSTSGGTTTGSSSTTSTATSSADSSSTATSAGTSQTATTAAGTGSTASAPSATSGDATGVSPTRARTRSTGLVTTAPAVPNTRAHRSGGRAATAIGLPSPAVLKQIEAMPMDKFSLPALPALLAGAPPSALALSPGEAPLVAGAASAGSRGAMPRIVASRSIPAQDGNAVGITLFACAAAAVAAGLARFRMGRPGS